MFKFLAIFVQSVTAAAATQPEAAFSLFNVQPPEFLKVSPRPLFVAVERPPNSQSPPSSPAVPVSLEARIEAIMQPIVLTQIYRQLKFSDLATLTKAAHSLQQLGGRHSPVNRATMLHLRMLNREMLKLIVSTVIPICSVAPESLSSEERTSLAAAFAELRHVTFSYLDEASIRSAMYVKGLMKKALERLQMVTSPRHAASD